MSSLWLFALFAWITLLSLAAAAPAHSYADIAKVINPNPYVATRGSHFPGQPYWPGGR